MRTSRQKPSQKRWTFFPTPFCAASISSAKARVRLKTRYLGKRPIDRATMNSGDLYHVPPNDHGYCYAIGPDAS